MIKNTVKLFIFILLLLPNLMFAASSPLTARIDRNNIAQGETFQLTISLNGKDTSAPPQLDVLDHNFVVFGSASNNQVTFINGKTSTRQQWIITLEPKKSGTLTIPPIKVGNYQTQAMKIAVATSAQVNPTSQTQPNKQASKTLFLETSLDPKSPYVGSQSTYIVKIYYALPLVAGSLTNPTSADALVIRLGQDINYQTSRNGHTYNVIERRYAIFPQKSGKLTLDPPGFSGRVVIPASASARFNLNQMFNDGTRVIRANARPITLDVKPKPASATNQWWLPSSGLKLTQTWSPKMPVFKVGEPITRTITLEARGITASQLPNFNAGTVTNINTYPDKPILKTQKDGTTVVGIRQEKIAYVPTQAGTITLPAIEIPWWNTKTKHLQTARLPTQSFSVKTGGGYTATSNNSQPRGHTTPAPIKLAQNNPSPNSELLPNATPRYWVWISLGLFCLWLITLCLWWLQRRARAHQASNERTPPSKETPEPLRMLVNAIKTACQTNNPQAAKEALINWAQAKWPQQRPRNLNDIMHCLAQPELHKIFAELTQCLYAKHNNDWDGAAFWETLQSALGQKNKKTNISKQELPDLYPE